MFKIRLLDESDAQAFQQLRLEALQNNPAAFAISWEEEQTYSLQSIRQRLCFVPNGNFVVGAFNEHHLIGMVGFLREERPKTRHKGVVWGVYVAPEERGKGIARALLRTLLEHVQSHSDLDQIILSVATPQVAARHLYTSLGFEVYAYERHALKVGNDYIDEEHLVLWMKLPSIS